MRRREFIPLLGGAREQGDRRVEAKRFGGL